jgi:hypothetical protein
MWLLKLWQGFKDPLGKASLKEKSKTRRKAKHLSKKSPRKGSKKQFLGISKSSFPNIPLKPSKFKSLTKKKLTKSQNSKNAKLTNRT